MDQGKKTLLLLLAVFLIPVLLGTGMYFGMDRLGIKPESINYGSLVTPAQPTRVEDLLQAGKPASEKAILNEKWTMLYVAGSECNQQCLDKLLLMKRVRLLMNEDMRRVRTVVVSNKVDLEAALKKENPDLVFTQVATDSSRFLSQFPNQQQSPIYMLDPLGNLMMFYPQAEPDVKLMLKDLKRLLKYSHLG